MGRASGMQWLDKTGDAVQRRGEDRAAVRVGGGAGVVVVGDVSVLYAVERDGPPDA